MLSTARSLAAAHPQAMVPCPACAASVRAENLDRHLGKTHPAALTEPDVTEWSGVDRRVRRPLVVILLLWCGAAAAAVAAGVGLLAITLVVPLALLVLAEFGVLRARLLLEGDVLRLRHSFGLGRREVHVPAVLEVGSLAAIRPSALTSSYADDMPDNWDKETVRVGTYLRLANGRRALTVGCPHHTGLRKHWAGWQQGKQRRQWDITVDPPAFVSLQYAIATFGALTPRS